MVASLHILGGLALHSLIWMASQAPAALQTSANSDAAGSAQAVLGQRLCGWIGVQVSPMTAAFAESLDMTELYGAIFNQPDPGSPAADAGIQAGDVITAINGSWLMTWSDFTTTISMTAPGTDVSLSTYRNGELIEVKVTLGSAKCRR